MDLSDLLIGELAGGTSRDINRHYKEVSQQLLARLFPQQHDYVTDRSRYKTALCPRRAGKTEAVCTDCVVTCLDRPNANVAYITLTRGMGKSNIWKTLQRLNDQYELGAKFHHTDLRVTFQNGSTIALYGAETLKEAEKLRGQSLTKVVIDEGKSFVEDVLRELITEIVKPALLDQRGTLSMIGTPGNVLAGLFYEATCEDFKNVRPWWKRDEWKAAKKPYAWSFHRWVIQDNIAVPHMWEDALVEKEMNGWDDNEPRWRREYLGEWCPSDDIRVYAFDESRNVFLPEDGPHGLPPDHEWRYILGADFGFEDDFALVVSAWSETHPVMFQVWDYKSPHLTVADMAKAIKKAHDTFGEFEGMIADAGGLGKTLIATLAEQYGYHFEKAEKKEKADHIELLNSDLRSGRIKLHPESALIPEMRLLQWEDNRRRFEDKGTPNHCCDAFLYQWRFAAHHYWTKREATIEPGTLEYYDLLDEEAFQKAVDQRKAELDESLDSYGSLEDLDGVTSWTWEI